MTEPQQASITEHGPIPFIVANFSQQVFGALGATPLGSVGALSKSNQMLCNQSLGTVPPAQVCVGVDPTTGAGRQESQPITSNVCAAECLGFGFIFEKISSAWMFIIVGVGFYFPTSMTSLFVLLLGVLLSDLLSSGAMRWESVGGSIFLSARKQTVGAIQIVQSADSRECIALPRKLLLVGLFLEVLADSRPVSAFSVA